MSSRGIKNKVVIITTFDKEVYEVDLDINAWNNLVIQTKALGEKKVLLKKYKVNLYFSTIKSEKEKTKFIALPSPNKPQTLLTMGSSEKIKLKKSDPELYYKMESEEKNNRKKIQQTALKHKQDTKKIKEKRFLKEREKILIRLSITEKNLGLRTTLNKIMDAEKYQKIKIKNNL